MARIAGPALAIAVSKARGLGFLAAGYTSEDLEEQFVVCFPGYRDSGYPGIPSLRRLVICPCSATDNQDLVEWADEIRAATSQETKIWVQVGSLADAIQVARIVGPDVLVLQGSDAGGHSQAHGASIVTVVPEVADKLGSGIQRPDGKTIQLIAARGISDGRGVPAAINLGAPGCALGTKFLASPEALVTQGYRDEILRASDGGMGTVSTTIYDTVRGIHAWPNKYNGRGIFNQTYLDSIQEMPEAENSRLYRQAIEQEDDQGYGPSGRLTTYAGTGVGLVNNVMAASDIVVSTRNLANDLLYGRKKEAAL